MALRQPALLLFAFVRLAPHRLPAASLILAEWLLPLGPPFVLFLGFPNASQQSSLFWLWKQKSTSLVFVIAFTADQLAIH
ncbi:hypothetical protein N658DRAFT_66626 [Parathielavia hyrcaniae]|uniref:Uncharacterized protein n=1 Tax=Parathielavia hyrcaniae TaxID=113614 RepID=A0AAN6Q1Q8_9PEZI|nr:hypothetical protein N658DRAFT_66626 [Parathielavia hyrcaniae]